MLEPVPATRSVRALGLLRKENPAASGTRQLRHARRSGERGRVLRAPVEHHDQRSAFAVQKPSRWRVEPKARVPCRTRNSSITGSPPRSCVCGGAGSRRTALPRAPAFVCPAPFAPVVFFVAAALLGNVVFFATDWSGRPSRCPDEPSAPARRSPARRAVDQLFSTFYRLRRRGTTRPVRRVVGHPVGGCAVDPLGLTWRSNRRKPRISAGFSGATMPPCHLYGRWVDQRATGAAVSARSICRPLAVVPVARITQLTALPTPAGVSRRFTAALPSTGSSPT